MDNEKQWFPGQIQFPHVESLVDEITRLRNALNRIITAYNENEPDLVHYDELYDVVGKVKNELTK